MSIIAYTGLPGSGKSYNAVSAIILPALQHGRCVISNIPLKIDELEREGIAAGFVQITNADLQRIHDIGADNPGSVMVLDEVWRLWPSGTQTRTMPEGHMQFLAEHRHQVGEDGLTTEIVLVTQDLKQVANCVRSLIEQTNIHKKLSALGTRKHYVVGIFQNAQTGTGRNSERVNTFRGKYKKEIYRFYSSHTQSSTGQAGLEKISDDRGSLFKNTGFIALAVFAVVGTIGGVYGAVAGLGSMIGDTEEVQEASGESAARERSGSGRAVSPDRLGASSRYQAALEKTPVTDLPRSEEWRVTGSYRDGKGPVIVFLSNGLGTMRTRGCMARYGEFVCEVDGKQVTAYTGARKERERGAGTIADNWAAKAMSSVEEARAR